MADQLARVTATLYRNEGAGDPAALLPLVGARVVATPVLLDETAAIIGSRARVVGVTDAAGVLWQTSPAPAEGALPGLSLAPGSWSWSLPDRETITATVTAGQVVDLLTLRGYVPGPGETVYTVDVSTFASLIPDPSAPGLYLIGGGSSLAPDPAYTGLYLIGAPA